MKKLLYAICIVFIACNSNKSSVADFSLIPVKSGQYWGYINTDGKFIINPQFSEANPFYEGLALIKATDGKYGFINEEGNFVINPVYKDATNFNNGISLVVKDNSKLEFINSKGETKIPLDAAIEKAHIFSEGLALVNINNKCGFINTDGKMTIPATFDDATDFSEGMAVVVQYDNVNKTPKYGFINKKGELVINYQFEHANNFKEGLALVINGSQVGYIGTDGKYVINPQFVGASSFIGQYAPFKQGELWGIIDKTGKIIINPQFKSVDGFYDNDMAAVASTDGKTGFIDKDGKYVINPQFDNATRFFNNLSIIRMGSKYGVIDKKGKITINPQFDNINTGKEYNEWVRSDYFDVNDVVSYIVESMTEKSFNGFSAATTFKNIKAMYPNLNENNYSSFVDFKAKENRFVQLKKISTSYVGGLTITTDSYETKQVYDPVAGGYTNQDVYSGSTSSTNPNALLSDFGLMYDLKGKAKEKKAEIVKALYDKLKAHGLTENGSTENYSSFKKKEFEVICNRISDYDIELNIYFYPDSDIEGD